MTKPTYRGRFAPSPTGELHLGTLLAAVGSYLQARSQHGKWLMRIEDVDTTRRVEGSSDALLRALESFGFEWDGAEVYQSQRTELYEAVLATLTNKELIYPCTCSRKQLADQGEAQVYAGHCRHRQLPLREEHALRIRVANQSVGFDDLVMGLYQQQLASECGDFVIKRRDGLYAYQLAVVVDDAEQGITEVVRGTDLLDSTPRQIYLQQQLSYAQPGYLHLPLLIDEHGHKLGKSTGAAALDLTHPVQHLHSSLELLGQQPPGELARDSLSQLWQWAINHWDIDCIPKQSLVIRQH
ncbi:MAG: tRNA glutamyl-Q(34) synthetase GluQRS [Gammaproteobacteria bacterium]|nr:tRNA glutamyl-Q(34) synthetase GluQRS [Gammaproteobacteria bacterium]MCK5263437.1 tRNA glutamyl-Q(34) synthetase GluQRS [Gammaproteobacteria bacterium]